MEDLFIFDPIRLNVYCPILEGFKILQFFLHKIIFFKITMICQNFWKTVSFDNEMMNLNLIITK